MSFPAGAMQCRVRIERRVVAEDGYGNRRSDWAPLASLACAFAPVFGAEPVEAGALTSSLRGVVTLHAGPSAKAIAASDRIVFETGPYKTLDPLQIRSILPRPDGATIEINVETGAPT